MSNTDRCWCGRLLDGHGHMGGNVSYAGQNSNSAPPDDWAEIQRLQLANRDLKDWFDAAKADLDEAKKEVAKLQHELKLERTLNRINCEMDEMCCQCQGLRDRIAELEKDAARYRWIANMCEVSCMDAPIESDADVDAMIELFDAAMADKP